ncbi:phosphoribosylanthranilate isomerase [Peijinzhouia sedimentorum]
MKKTLKIKVCGMRFPDNIEELRGLKINWMGLIFHPLSPRWVPESEREELLAKWPGRIKRVGVFVDQSPFQIIEEAQKWRLHYIQLHGKYSPYECEILKEAGLLLIKVFSPTPDFNWDSLLPYEGLVDYFLFDTSGKLPGGNGFQFDWSLLDNYQGNTPFLLSGGIGPEDAQKVLEFNHPAFAGIDLNSRFEYRPAKKKAELLTNFLQAINNQNINGSDR